HRDSEGAQKVRLRILLGLIDLLQPGFATVRDGLETLPDLVNRIEPQQRLDFLGPVTGSGKDVFDDFTAGERKLGMVAKLVYDFQDLRVVRRNDWFVGRTGPAFDSDRLVDGRNKRGEHHAREIW